MDTNSLFSFILIISIIGAFLCITGFIGTNMISKRMSYNYLSIILIISVNWRPARNSNIPRIFWYECTDCRKRRQV